MTGTVVSHYRVLRKLGEGGMGIVYEAEDTRLGRRVALKFLPERLALDHAALDRFRREARAASALNHPHICTIHDIDEACLPGAAGQTTPFIAMELLEGEPLRERLAHGRLPVPAIVETAIQLADALEAAHTKGIVHRDLKPENIFLTTRGTAKLLDFGIAKLAAEQAAMTAAATVTRVDTGPLALGTLAYMSPEQVRGEPLDGRTDLFSLGVVIYELLTGVQPFRGTTSGAVVGEILTKAPTAPVRLNADVPPELERIVNKLLEKDREFRHQSAREVRVDLERLRRAAQTTVGEPGTRDVLPSIAVLPFVNMSGDPEQEYFSDGLAEDVINVLSRMPGLKVIARTSAFAFKGKLQDVRAIAGALGVGSILEGSVRKAGNRLRVTVQLVTAEDGSHLWAERYDRQLTYIFAIQDEIASAIASALEVTLSARGVSARHAASPEAYEAYLKALYLLWKLSPEALARCKESLDRAVALAPDFALAHFGMAQHAWMLASMGAPGDETMPVVRRAAKRALDLDPSLADAQAMLGVVAASYDHDWEEAERRFRLAMAHDPIPANAHLWYAYYCLVPTGRASEAVEHAGRGIAGDPLSISAHLFCGTCAIGARDLAKAEAEARHVLKLEEHQMFACSILAAANALQGKWSQAREAAERAFPQTALIQGQLAGILRSMGETARAEEIVQEFLSGRSYDAPLGLGWSSAFGGDPDAAAEWFGKAAERRHPDAAHHASLALGDIRRWPALAKRLKLPGERFAR